MDYYFSKFLQTLPDEQLFPLIFHGLYSRSRESIENFDQKYNTFLQGQPRKRVEFVMDTTSCDFCLSDEAINLINKYKGVCCVYDGKCHLPRDDPILVKVVKELEERASNFLSLIEVHTAELLPGDYIYIIIENGIEKVVIGK